jgi:hypothetical protein
MPTSRTRTPGQTARPPRTAVQPLATIEIDAVTPSAQGFTLTGQGIGADPASYHLDIRFDLPLDVRTRAVVGELLSQSDITVYRSDTPRRNS